MSRNRSPGSSSEIRQHFGFRECGKEDGAKLAEFLASGLAQRERRYELIKEQFLGECRLRQLEPPSADQVEREPAGEALLAGAVTEQGRTADAPQGSPCACGRAQCRS